jgi:uncharacterized glyoxalase superfamily protein PhnB/uncharacterized protein YndB with AHSA1/START domain
MNSNLLFDFTVNKENNSINVKREFAAPIDRVWSAWTTPEILDQWWAPKPYQVKTKEMNFSVGGRWLYAMVGPEGGEQWCKLDYKSIDPLKSYSGVDAFCDSNGGNALPFPKSLWTNTFTSEGEKTLVDILIKYEDLSDLEKIIEIGFKEGFTACMQNLDQYLSAQHKLWIQNKNSNKSRVCTYLNFPGNTEEAFLFYQSVFKTEFVGKGIQRFGDIPADTGHPPVAEEIKKMVLHVELPTLGNHLLMGTDAPKEMGFTLVQGNNMHISIETETREEANRIFAELSAGGNVTMPLQDMFFGSYYGSITDKYGINWMINHINQ